MGQLYLSFDAMSPEKIWPGTKWTQITGHFLRAANDTSTGGSDTAALSLGQLPKWSATIGARPGNNDTVASAWAYSGSVTGATASATSGMCLTSQSRTCHSTLLTFSFGNGESHNNMPKYQDVYVWRRTA